MGEDEARVTKQVEDIADELLDIYAERESQRKALPIRQWMPIIKNLKMIFPIQKRDQMRSIEEVNQDLSKKQPMDRFACRATLVMVRQKWLCAVPFVWLKLANKSLFSADNRPCPAALRLFCERFERISVEIEVLSRFKTAKESQDNPRTLS